MNRETKGHRAHERKPERGADYTVVGTVVKRDQRGGFARGGVANAVLSNRATAL